MKQKEKKKQLGKKIHTDSNYTKFEEGTNFK